MSVPRQTTRRQFLTGSAASDQIADMSTAVPAGDSARTAEEPGGSSDAGSAYLMQIARRAMACDFAVFVNAGQVEHAADYAMQALDLVDRLEDQLSIYRQHSEVSQLNRVAGQGPFSSQRNLFELLGTSIDIYELTDGAFDITAAPLTQLWSQVRQHGRIPDDHELQATLRNVGSDKIALDSDSTTVEFLQPEVQINLGGIGKGYALDCCAELLTSRGLSDFLIHGGQSSVAARGDRLAGVASRGWMIGLKHPLRPDQRLAEIQLCDRALGTSGSATHAYRFQGRRIGHILDPRSGQPAEGVLSATVLANDAATADALSTAFYVLGVDRASRICDARPDLAAIFVIAGARTGTIQLVPMGLSQDEYRQVAD